MKSALHALAASCALVLIALFLLMTLYAELVGSIELVVRVKQLIVTPGLWLLLPCLMVTGALGFQLGKKSRNPYVLAKKRRMPFIVANGLLILIPCALYLEAAASQYEFDNRFYIVQALEVVAGAINLTLMSRNWLDGWRLRNHFRSKRVTA